ncbi:hypothetical protein LC608_19010 [Nostoc sp. XA010]|uniref:CIS tube protein n=1 Tax=Nostoc sp. XA010 TaxID=2780407 RepID=UPI001E503F9B|nr:hypothetical protein [Nostoc sp. XA010]MCC5659026.1 hypothetical protein [Nostoc sp. XA010]
MPLEKAKLMSFYPGEAPTIEFMFNPTQMSIQRTCKWQSEPGNRGNAALPKVNFSGVDPYKLTLSQIVFDTYETRNSVIDQYLKNIKKGVESPDGKDKRPPVYILAWGKKQSFPCVMLSISYKIDKFLADGTPVRAIVDISLQEVDKENPPGDHQSASKGANRQKDSIAARKNRASSTQKTNPFVPESEQSSY